MDKWRLIVDPDLTGVENMARDEALVMGAETGAGDMPVLRLYGWSEPTISIGYVQEAASLVRAGLPVVRRMTGGRAVIHDDEVTYSITAPIYHPLFTGGIACSYAVISGCIVAALKNIGISATLSRSAGRGRGEGRAEACFHAPSRSEVLVDGRKLVGSSQRRFKRAFLQHGSILFSIDLPAHERAFGHGLVDKMACVSSLSRAGKEEFREALTSSFSAGLGVGFIEGGLTTGERAAADELMAGRYSTLEWNARRHRNTAGSAPAQ